MINPKHCNRNIWYGTPESLKFWSCPLLKKGQTNNESKISKTFQIHQDSQTYKLFCGDNYWEPIFVLAHHIIHSNIIHTKIAAGFIIFGFPGKSFNYFC